jgi:Spy/CpxP family protein refolding chaperone
MNFKSKLIAGAAVIVLGASTAYAQMGGQMSGMDAHQAMGGDMGDHHGMMMHDGSSPFLMLLKSANLTSAQKDQVHQILKSVHAKMSPLMEQQHSIEAQIGTRLLGPSAVSSADLAPLVQQAQQARQQIDQNMIDAAIAIRNILTPDQVRHLAKVHQQLQNLHAQIQQLMGSERDESMSDQN